MIFHTNFIGQLQQHNYWLYKILDDVIAENKHIRSIVEIGTGNGALTLVLGLWGLRLNIPVVSVDINQDRCAPIGSVLNTLQVLRLNVDERSQECTDAILKHVDSQPCLMICDGGNKVWEVNHWCKLLPKNSILAAHDWSNEIKEADVLDAEAKYITPLHKGTWLEENVQMAWWRVK